MKWIGQHIWSFISRFRNDVYLEDLETTTETSALVVDSNGKVSKNVTSGVNMTNGDDNRVVTAVGTNGLQAETYLQFVAEDTYSLLQILDYNGTLGHDYFEIQVNANGATKLKTVDNSDALAHFEIEADGNITLDSAGDIGIECAGGEITCDADKITFSSASADDPTIIIKNTADDNQAARIQMRKDRGAAMADNDRIGEIDFFGEDANQNSQQYAKLQVRAVETDHGQETGKFEVFVAQYDGGVGLSGFVVKGTTTDNTIDVDLGRGTASNTTVAGNLGVTNDLTVTNEIRANGDTHTFESANDNDPVIVLKNTHNGANCARLNFVKDKGAAGAGDDLVGSILFTGDNAAQEQTNFAFITTKIAQEADTDEAGEFLVEVATSNGSASSLQEGLKITGTASTNLLNVEIGHGDSSMTTVAGDLRISKNLTATRSYTNPGTDVAAHEGGDVYFYGTCSTVQGSIYYMNSSGGWSLADADAESTASGLLAVALGTDPDVDGMLLRGFVTLLTEIEGTEAVGSTLYLSATDGGVATITQPSGPGDIVRVIGYSLHATNNAVYFNPSGTFVEVS